MIKNKKKKTNWIKRSKSCKKKEQNREQEREKKE